MDFKNVILKIVTCQLSKSLKFKENLIILNSKQPNIQGCKNQIETIEYSRKTEYGNYEMKMRQTEK